MLEVGIKPRSATLQADAFTTWPTRQSQTEKETEYACWCVCVCVCVWKREREAGRHRERMGQDKPGLCKCKTVNILLISSVFGRTEGAVLLYSTTTLTRPLCFLLKGHCSISRRRETTDDISEGLSFTGHYSSGMFIGTRCIDLFCYIFMLYVTVTVPADFPLKHQQPASPGTFQTECQYEWTNHLHCKGNHTLIKSLQTTTKTIHKPWKAQRRPTTALAQSGFKPRTMNSSTRSKGHRDRKHQSGTNKCLLTQNSNLREERGLSILIHDNTLCAAMFTAVVQHKQDSPTFLQHHIGRTGFKLGPPQIKLSMSVSTLTQHLLNHPPKPFHTSEDGIWLPTRWINIHNYM